MTKPKIGESVTAYFGAALIESKVVEWKGNKCFFDNGWYLIWNDEIGFRL